MKSITKIIACASLLVLISCGVEAQSETTVVATGTTAQPDVSVLAEVLIPTTQTTVAPETTTTTSTTIAPTTVKKTTTTTAKPVTTKPKPTTTPKPVGNVEQIIRDAAEAHGISPDRLVRVARCESTLNPNAKNGQYGGLFQFSDKTWDWFASMRGVGGSKWNASDAANMAAWAFANGYASHWECK